MTHLIPDEESRAAVDALVYRLRHREDEDDEGFAIEFIAALRIRGWRPTDAKPLPDWRRQREDREHDAADPNTEYQREKAAMLRRIGHHPHPAPSDDTEEHDGVDS